MVIISGGGEHRFLPADEKIGKLYLTPFRAVNFFGIFNAGAQHANL